jgi:hypothetical protein
MLAEISAGLSSLNAAKDIIKGISAVKGEVAVNEAKIELQRIILEAHGSLLAAQEAQATNLGTIRDLEQEIVRLKAWDGERENYELAEIERGATVYIVKPEVKTSEAPHWLCAHCFNDHRKGILQPQGHIDGERTWQCPGCKATVRVPYSQTPKERAGYEEWKRLGPGAECPRCREKTLRTQSISKPLDHGLVLLGVEMHQMKCSHCDFEVERQKDPKD